MIERKHPLVSPSPGTTRELLSLHYGPTGTGPQGHDPGLAARRRGAGRCWSRTTCADASPTLEARGALRGEVVLVPFANPIGLSQRVLQSVEGRFDLASGENFNRRYADLVPRACELLRAEARRRRRARACATVREALREACAELPAATELESLRRTLLGLAIDADVVLDLHCDNEAVLHLYTAPELWTDIEPLARLMGARAVLVAEALGRRALRRGLLDGRGRASPRSSRGASAAAVTLPSACVAVTVELRGERDVQPRTRRARCRAHPPVPRGARSRRRSRPRGCRRSRASPRRSRARSRWWRRTAAWWCSARARRHAATRRAARGDRRSAERRRHRRSRAPPTACSMRARAGASCLPGTRIAKVAGREAVRTGRLLSD